MSIGCALFMLVIVGTWSTVGIEGIVDDGLEVADGNSLTGELLQREVDHLNWVQALSAYLNDENVTELNIQLDHTKCGFGKWYYGKGREEAEALLLLAQQRGRVLQVGHLEWYNAAMRAIRGMVDELQARGGALRP